MRHIPFVNMTDLTNLYFTNPATMTAHKNKYEATSNNEDNCRRKH